MTDDRSRKFQEIDQEHESKKITEKITEGLEETLAESNGIKKIALNQISGKREPHGIAIGKKMNENRGSKKA